MKKDEHIKKSLAKQIEILGDLNKVKKPYHKIVGGIDIAIFPQVYFAGVDSELLLDKIAVKEGDKCLDLCTGSGIIALKMKALGARSVVAIDINPEAVKNATYNSKKTRLGIDVREGNLFGPVSGDSFDVVTINPPYTNKKPSNKMEMMFWDEDYNLIRSFFSQLGSHLSDNGRSYLAWSSFGDNKLIRDLAKANNLSIRKIGSRVGVSGFEFYVYLIRKK